MYNNLYTYIAEYVNEEIERRGRHITAAMIHDAIEAFEAGADGSGNTYKVTIEKDINHA